MNLENKLKKAVSIGALATIAATSYAALPSFPIEPEKTRENQKNEFVVNEDNRFIDSVYAPIAIFGGAYALLTIAGITYEKFKGDL